MLHFHLHRLGSGGGRGRVDDRRIRALREIGDDFHRRIDLGVGLVDDPERRLPAPASTDEVRRLADTLNAMLETLELAPSWTLDVVGPVSAADQSELDALLTSSGAASRVRFHGRKPPVEAWALAAGAWAGLSLLEPTPAFVAAAAFSGGASVASRAALSSLSFTKPADPGRGR